MRVVLRYFWPAAERALDRISGERCVSCNYAAKGIGGTS